MAKGQVKQAQVKIDQVEFEKLCSMQCTREEIYSWFGVSKETLLRWCKNTYDTDFETAFKKFSDKGKVSLRRAQLYKATTGKMDTTMLIWLGKQYLGQTDKIEAENVEKVQIVNDVKCEPTDR